MRFRSGFSLFPVASRWTAAVFKSRFDFDSSAPDGSPNGAIRFPLSSFLHKTCCLIMVSYGLPVRNLLHETHMAAAMETGLDLASIDPTDSVEKNIEPFNERHMKNPMTSGGWNHV
jgi:hypothetical protein